MENTSLNHKNKFVVWVFSLLNANSSELEKYLVCMYYMVCLKIIIINEKGYIFLKGINNNKRS
jgi:hypothetical protein